MRLTGGAAERLKAILPPGTEPFIHLTLTDEQAFAQAFVVIEARAARPVRRSPVGATPAEISVPSQCSVLRATQ